MPEERHATPAPSSSRRSEPPPAGRAVSTGCSLPDLFGHVAQPAAASTRPSSSRLPALAEWPAAGSDRPPAPPPPRRAAAADRPGRSGGSLTGTYDRRGASLRRSDGLALIVCLSHRGRRSAGDSERYVTVATPGGGKPLYAGNLYGDAAAADDLDGCQFQDGETQTRYALRLAGSDRYTVAPVLSRRGGRVAP